MSLYHCMHKANSVYKSTMLDNVRIILSGIFTLIPTILKDIWNYKADCYA